MSTEPGPGAAGALDAGWPVERPLTIADAQQIADIRVEMERAEPADEHTSTQEVIEELTGPTVDLPRASVGLFDGDTMVAYSAVSEVHDDRVWKGMLDVGVRASWTASGAGDRALAVAEDLAVAWKAREAPDLAGELMLWIPTERRSMQELADRRGYETWRYFFTLRRELADPVDPQRLDPQRLDPQRFGAGYSIREFQERDVEPVRLAHNEAFADHWGSVPSTPERWRAHLVKAASFRAAHSFVAITDDVPDQIAGYVMAEEFDSETAARGFRTGYIGLVGTLRRARGRGIATALLDRQLGSFRLAGFRCAELGVDSDSPTGAGRIYQRAGFVERHRTRAVGKRFR